MISFLQYSVREQHNCSEQFTEILRHPGNGTSEYGQSDDWRVPAGDTSTFGHFVFTGESLTFIHEARSGAQCSPLLLPRHRVRRATYGDLQRRGLPTGLINCRISAVGVTDQAWVEGNCKASSELKRKDGSIRGSVSSLIRLGIGRIGSWTHHRGSKFSSVPAVRTRYMSIATAS